MAFKFGGEATHRVAARQFEKLSLPVSRLVKATRKNIGAGSNDVNTFELKSDFDQLDSVELKCIVLQPKVVESVPHLPTTITELECSLSKNIIGKAAQIRLRPGVGTEGTDTLENPWRSSTVTVSECDLKSFIGGKAVSNIEVSHVFGSVSVSEEVVLRQDKPASLAGDIELSAWECPAADARNVTIIEHGRKMTRTKERAASDSFFEHERRLIAQDAKIGEGRVKWIGLFRNVPLAGVKSMTVDETHGRLMIELRNDAQKVLAMQKLRTVNIAMGRDVQSGSILQIVMPSQ